MLRSRRPALVATTATVLLSWLIAPLACGWKSHFADMKARIDAMPIPQSYEMLYETQRGVKPPFFGDHPTVNRFYRSPTDPAATCETLAGLLQELSWEESRYDWGCTFSVRVPSGWRARLSRVPHYQGVVLVAAMRPDRPDRHPAEPQGAYTRVAVTLKDVR